LEGTEVVDLGAKHQVGQLSVGQEDDEEHDGEADEVLGTARHGGGQLAHGLVEVDELEQKPGYNSSVFEKRYINSVFLKFVLKSC
jgi:hypothetical protein